MHSQRTEFKVFIIYELIYTTTTSCWAVKATPLYASGTRLWKSSGKYFPLFRLIKLFPFFLPLSLYLPNCLFFQILACAMFILLAALSWSKTAHSFASYFPLSCYVTKRRLAGTLLLPDQLPRTEALVRKRTHWFSCSFLLPRSYVLPQLPSLGLSTLYVMLAASLHRVWGKGCICLTRPFYFSVLVPTWCVCWLCLFFSLWWAKQSRKRKIKKRIIWSRVCSLELH